MSKKADYSSREIPVALTVAGSDSSGGAGIQADLKTMTRLKVYGCSAVTCIVAEHPGKVLNMTPVPAARVLDQIRLVEEVYPIAAMKTGMLYSRGIISVIVDWLETSKSPPALVIDPVMVATSGTALLKPAAMKALKEKLIPHAACVTPNLDEASVLLNRPLKSIKAVEAACRDAYQYWNVPFLIKGGHLKGNQAVDVLYDGKQWTHLVSERLPNIDTHGTGCTFSAAMTSGLASGLSLVRAAKLAKRYTYRAMRDHFQLRWLTPLNHIQ